MNRIGFFAIRLALISLVAISTNTLTFSQTPIPQNVLWRVVVSDTDRMTTFDINERDAFPDEGQMFYIPTGCSDTRGATLFRYNNGPDHREGLDSVMPGYSQEGPLGCPWQLGTPLPGLQPIFEDYNPKTGDYAINLAGNKIPGYTQRLPLKVMGYKRYRNAFTKLLTLNGGAVHASSNLVTGGTLWNLTWNGIQYLNHAGYGRAMVMQMYFDTPSGSAAAVTGGDLYSGFPDVAANIHGAPLVTAFNDGNVQTTLAVPLEYYVDDWGGGVNNPVVWQDLVVGKQLTLNFQGHPTVAKYQSVVYLPPPGNLNVDLVDPATYLRGLFTRYFTYDAGADQLTEITSEVPACAPTAYGFAADFGGIIVSNGAGDYALGLYAANLSVGGSVSDILVRPRICPELGGYWENPSSEDSYSTVVIRPRIFGPMNEGINTFNRYLVTDTLENVRLTMHDLYVSGVK